MNATVGASKVFSCPTCSTRLPRDWNAARKIFLRHHVATSTLAVNDDAGLGLVPVLAREMPQLTKGTL